MRYDCNYDFFITDKLAILAGWGKKILENGSVTNTGVSNLKVSALQVFSTEDCREQMTVDEIAETGFTVDQGLISNKFRKGFTSDVSCLGNDFNLAEGMCCTLLQKLSKSVVKVHNTSIATQ